MPEPRSAFCSPVGLLCLSGGEAIDELDIAPIDPAECRRLSARTGRLLRILRVHGLIYKIQNTTRYRLSAQGQLLTAALFATRNADVRQLLRTAA